MLGYGYAHTSSRPSRRRSSRRTSDAPRLYTTEESARILEASRDALRRGGRHTQANDRGYYAFPRPVAPVIPPYEEFLAQARARLNYGDAHRVNPGSTAYQSFRPDPYLYGYPSGYYNVESRAPLSHYDSARSRKTDRSSTLVGTESRRSSTAVDSHRTSYNSGRDSYPPRRSSRVHWGPNYTLAEPPLVSRSRFSNNTPSQHRTVSGSPYHAPPTHPHRSHRVYSPDYPTRPLNLSPSHYSGHDTYVPSTSADRRYVSPEERRARHDELRRELSAGGAVSRWSPDTVKERKESLGKLTEILRGLNLGGRRR